LKWCLQDRPSCCIAAPAEDENINMPIKFPLSKRGLGGFEILPALSLRGAQRRGNLFEPFFPSEEEGVFLPDMIRISFIPIPQFNK